MPKSPKPLVMNVNMVDGKARMSDRREPPSCPTTRTPSRMACKLKAVEMMVNKNEAEMLTAKFGVPRSQCIKNSIVCENAGIPIIAARVAT